MTADFKVVYKIAECFIFTTVTAPDRDYIEVADRIEDFETKFLSVFDLTYLEKVTIVDMIETAYQERFGSLIGE